MYDEQHSLPQLDFNLNSYARDDSGRVANIEDARAIIHDLHKIIQFLLVSPFEGLSLTTQSEISLYLVGAYLLTHNIDQQDPQYQQKQALLEMFSDETFFQSVKQKAETLNVEEILQSVEFLFKDFGEQQ